MHSLMTSPAAGIDEQWYRRLKPLMMDIGETFVALMPSDERLQQAYSEFIVSGYQANPNLFPDVPQADSLQSSRPQLEQLRADIRMQESDAEVKDLYFTRIDELLANIDMILAAKAGDAEGFRKANEFIYGSPDTAILGAAVSWLRQEVARDYAAVSPELRDEILRLLPEIDGDPTLLLPSDDVFRVVKDLHFQPGGYVEQLFNGTKVPDGTLITPAIGDPIIRRVIQNVGSDFELADSPALWAVLQSQRQVMRPTTLALTKVPFMGIVSHEVGSHLLESSNGAKAKLKLLELGLDRYEAGNEGRAFLREQIMFDSFADYIDQPDWRPTKASWEYRVAIHLTISLALGLAGRVYTFAELYHLLTLLFRFWTAKRGQPISEGSIRDGAWNMAIRALKGTDGNGGAYVKDIVYLEGNIRCWQAAKRRPELILYGDFGKFDIANERHVTTLGDLGILPVILS